jgi:hypothetical protein
MRYLPFHGGNTGSNPVRVATPSTLVEGLKHKLCGLFAYVHTAAPKSTEMSRFPRFFGSEMAADWRFF